MGIRSRLSVALTALAAIGAAFGGAGPLAEAAWSPGPRVFFVGVDLGSLRIELLSASPRGKEVRRVAGGGFFGTVMPPLPETSPPSWSADGASMAFVGLSRNSTQVFLTSGGDRAPRPVPKTRGARLATLSPDGAVVVFARSSRDESSTAIWHYDRATDRLRRLTPSRSGLHMAPSTFSPDGTMLAITAQDPRRGLRALALDLATGKRWVLARRAAFPAFSPDGSRLAYVSLRGRQRIPGSSTPAGDLYVKSLPAGKPKRLTRTKGKAETTPSWDPSGERLAYAAHRGPIAIFGLPSALMQINADGSCPGRLYGSRQTAALVGYFSPAWQPGPGREAGRINC